MRAPMSVSLRRLGSIRFQKNGFLWAYGADFAKLIAPKFFLFAGAAGAIHCRPKPSQYVDMLETVEFFFHLEAVLKFVDINFMSCFRGCPVLLFEKDSGSYLTEKRRTGQTGKSRKRIFDKFQDSF